MLAMFIIKTATTLSIVIKNSSIIFSDFKLNGVRQWKNYNKIKT